MTTFNKVDMGKIYFGFPYPITDKITIYQPTIRQIIEYGETEFFMMLYMFIGNTTFRRLELWNIGMDWNKISDYELFCSIVPGLSVDKTSILFGDIDFSKFEMMEIHYKTPPEPDPDPVDENGNPRKLTATERRNRRFKKFETFTTLYNEEQDIEISATVYHHIVDVLCEMFQTRFKAEYTVGKTAKELIIDEEKEKLKRAMKEAKPSSGSNFIPLISACVNHPGFKYNKEEVLDENIAFFMDAVKRLQVFESTHALLGGMYSGFCDVSKIPKDDFDFMRPLTK